MDNLQNLLILELKRQDAIEKKHEIVTLTETNTNIWQALKNL